MIGFVVVGAISTLKSSLPASKTALEIKYVTIISSFMWDLFYISQVVFKESYRVKAKNLTQERELLSVQGTDYRQMPVLADLLPWLYFVVCTEECKFKGKELRESDFWPRPAARVIHAIPYP